MLGEHAVGLDRETKQRFISSGLIHLLAASGMNIGIIGLPLLGLGRRARLSRRLYIPITMVCVAFYALLTGLPPSILRAGAMFEIACLLKLIRRELDILTVLCLSGFLLTLTFPDIVTNLGFQLSFLSTFGIISMVPPLQEKIGFYITRPLAGILLVPLVAQLWVSPLLLYVFHQVQLMSLPANLVALPIVGVITEIGFILGGLSLVAPTVTGWCLQYLGVAGAALDAVAGFFANLPFALLHMPSPPLTSILMLMALLFLGALVLQSGAAFSLRRALSVSVLVLMLAFTPPLVNNFLQHGKTSVVVLPHRYGPASIVVTLPRHEAFVQVSQTGRYAMRDLASFLHHEGINRISMLMLTSPRIRQLNGLPELFKTMPVTQLYTPRLSSDQSWWELLSMASDANVSIVPQEATQRLHAGSIEGLSYLYPPTAMQQTLQVPGGCIRLSRKKNDGIRPPWENAPAVCDPLSLEFTGPVAQVRFPSVREEYPVYDFTRFTMASGNIRVEGPSFPRSGMARTSPQPQAASGLLRNVKTLAQDFIEPLLYRR